MGITLFLSLYLWMQGNYSLLTKGVPDWQNSISWRWIPRFGINIHLALDGLSLLMVVLTALLGLLAILCSGGENQPYPGLLPSEPAVDPRRCDGRVLAMDLFLFFFFWEMMLVPMYFLIALWGHSGSDNKTHYQGSNQVLHLHRASGSG